MYKKILCSMLIVGLLNLVCFSQVSNVKTTADSATQIKEAVNKIGINRRVRVKMLDERKINGFIREIKADSFIVVINEKSNSETDIQFSQVKEIKYTGIGVGGKAVIVVLGVALGVASFVAFAFLFGRRN